MTLKSPQSYKINSNYDAKQIEQIYRYLRDDLKSTDDRFSAWIDQLSDAVSIKRKTGASAKVVDNDTESAVTFKSGSDLTEFLYVNVQLNHNKQTASSVYPHIHFFQTSSAIPNFLLQYRWQANLRTKTGTALVPAWTYLKCNTLAVPYTTGIINQICYSNKIAPPSNSNLSDILQFKIYRDYANGSSQFAGGESSGLDVDMVAFDVHFAIDSLGSTSEYVK
jgi:hypothetical protein